MLSPHEFATLMLVCHAPDQVDMNRAELDVLLERQLVMLENSAEGRRCALPTERGRSLLDAFGSENARGRPGAREHGVGRNATARPRVQPSE